MCVCVCVCVCLQGRSWGGRSVQVIRIPKSGGVVTREKDERKALRNSRLKDYFYGYVHLTCLSACMCVCVCLCVCAPLI